jgi:uncharacterized protein
MPRSGYADLPLHYGRVPSWLAERMTLLGGAIIETIAIEYGKTEVLRRLSDPLWFQSLGCVLGMDWHSSGITTSVMGALKRAINPRSHELGIYICGGRGKHSRNTPNELLKVADKTGLNGNELVRSSKLVAKVDNTAIQDGFQLYLHNFIVTTEGEWSVVQQGLNDSSGMARRYHWHSKSFQSYLAEPHVGITGINQGLILNLTHHQATSTRTGILEIAREKPATMLDEIRKIVMPRHHEVQQGDVGLVLCLCWLRKLMCRISNRCCCSRVWVQEHCSHLRWSAKSFTVRPRAFRIRLVFPSRMEVRMGTPSLSR